MVVYEGTSKSVVAIRILGVAPKVVRKVGARSR